MENDQLTQIWDSQKKESPLMNPGQIIKKADKLRKKQFIGVAVMSITVVVLLIYAGYYASGRWNDFTLGLVLMIGSLTFRVILEFISLYRKESRLIALDNRAFKHYLKKHYKLRLKINYFITPLCFAVYVYGLLKLLPYFKQAFSAGFYTYILISGFVSLLVIAVIIVNNILNENKFLNQLRSE